MPKKTKRGLRQGKERALARYLSRPPVEEREEGVRLQGKKKKRARPSAVKEVFPSLNRKKKRSSQGKDASVFQEGSLRPGVEGARATSRRNEKETRVPPGGGWWGLLLERRG